MLHGYRNVLTWFKRFQYVITGKVGSDVASLLMIFTSKSKEGDLRILGGVKGAGLQKPALFTPDQ